MEENINTIEELNATIAELKAENEALKEVIIETKNQSEKAHKEAEMYRSWFGDASNEKDRIKSVMQAIATLLAAIQ